MTPPASLARCALALAALLALGALPAPAAAPDPCDPPTGGFAVLGPPTVYGFVGVPLATAPFSSTSTGTVAWRGDCDPLPDGVTFDPATRSYTGTPTTAGTAAVRQFADDGADSAIGGANLEILPASALTVAVTDADDDPLDVDAVLRGDAYRMLGAGLPGGTTVTATWNGAVLDTEQTADAGTFALEAEVPLDAAAGAHRVDLDLVLPSGQRYATAVTLTVRVLTLSGPTSLTPVAGAAAGYGYIAQDATAPVRYSVVGALPAGLALDATTGRLHGTPTAAGPARTVQVVATDGRATEGLAVTLTVLSAQTIVPAINLSPVANPALRAGLLGLSPQELQELDARALEARMRAASGALTVTYSPGGAPGFGIAPASGAPATPTAGGPVVVGTDNAAAALMFAELAGQAQRDTEAADLASNLAAQDFARHQVNTMFLQGILDTANDPATYADVMQGITREHAAALRDMVLKMQYDLLSAQNQIIERVNWDAAGYVASLPEPAPLPAGTQVVVELHSTPVLLARTTVDATGAFALSVTPPENVTPGRHHLVVSYRFPDGSRHTTSVPVSVPGLPETGAEPPTWAYTAALLAILLGLTLVAARRRWDAGAC